MVAHGFKFNPDPTLSKGRTFVEGQRIRVVTGGREVILTVDAVSEDGRTLTVSEVAGDE